MKPRGHNLAIAAVSYQATAACMIELRIIEDNQSIAMPGQQGAAIVIIPPSLLAARHARHRNPVIEQLHALGMLPLVVFDHEAKIVIICIDGKR